MIHRGGRGDQPRKLSRPPALAGVSTGRGAEGVGLKRCFRAYGRGGGRDLAFPAADRLFGGHEDSNFDGFPIEMTKR